MIVSNYFREIAKFLPVDFEVEGVPFELMPLTDNLIEKLKDENDSETAIKLAADWSLSYDGLRVIDNEKMKSHIVAFWVDEELPEAEPELKIQVGNEAIKISGLSDYIEELQEEEELAAMEAEEKKHIDGDDEDLDLNVPMGQIQQELNAAHNVRT